MTVEEAAKLKTIAEAEVKNILNKLEQDTKCLVSAVVIENAAEEDFLDKWHYLNKRVWITLEVK